MPAWTFAPNQLSGKWQLPFLAKLSRARPMNPMSEFDDSLTSFCGVLALLYSFTETSRSATVEAYKPIINSMDEQASWQRTWFQMLRNSTISSRQVPKLAWVSGFGMQNAPTARFVDFLRYWPSYQLNRVTKPGQHWATTATTDVGGFVQARASAFGRLMQLLAFAFCIRVIFKKLG